MALLDAPDFYGHTLFCDDIRAEADGKMMFIGVYLDQMFVHSDFPVTLPKFGFGITFVQKQRLFDPNLGIRIFLPQDSDDAPSIQADMREQVQPEGPANQQPIVTLRANLVFAPFTITAPGLIKVRIARGDDLVRLGILSVMRTQQAPAPH